MKKQIVCPVCNGSGHVVWTNKTEDTCSTGSKICPHCDGTGTRMVDMTNADRFREMSDEDLAYWIMCPQRIDRDMCNGRMDCFDCCLEWLKKPVDE